MIYRQTDCMWIFHDFFVHAGRHDSSGIRLHYTPSLRRYDAGIMELGLIYTPIMAIPPKQRTFYLSGYCTSKCTKTVCALNPHHGSDFENATWISQLRCHVLQVFCPRSTKNHRLELDLNKSASVCLSRLCPPEESIYLRRSSTPTSRGAGWGQLSWGEAKSWSWYRRTSTSVHTTKWASVGHSSPRGTLVQGSTLCALHLIDWSGEERRLKWTALWVFLLLWLHAWNITRKYWDGQWCIYYGQWAPLFMTWAKGLALQLFSSFQSLKSKKSPVSDWCYSIFFLLSRNDLKRPKPTMCAHWSLSKTANTYHAIHLRG